MVKALCNKEEDRDAKPWIPEHAAVNVTLHPERLSLPLHWKKRRMFVNSMSDLFHEQVPDGFIAQVLAIIAATPQHTYQVLTKRPERMRDLGNAEGFWELVDYEWDMLNNRGPGDLPSIHDALDHLWLGVSAENQHWADMRIPLLLETPAAVRFLSCEPLLGPVPCRRWQTPVLRQRSSGRSTGIPAGLNGS